MTLDVSTLKASAFHPYISESFHMVDEAGVEILVRLIRCGENPRGEMPGSVRTPFSLEFEAESENVPPFQWGNFSIVHPNFSKFGPVYVSRVLNPTSPNKPLFQVVFG